ncbi:hypothetical protein [Methanosarcina siciliae]|nr:hypothetical protein [Methanosarcina siciliae]
MCDDRMDDVVNGDVVISHHDGDTCHSDEPGSQCHKNANFS